LLVVANRTLDGEELRAELLDRAHKGMDFQIVAPTLALCGPYDSSDTDAEMVATQERLRDALRWAHGHRIRASGAIGDPNVGMSAIGDELRRSGATDVLVATLPRGRSNWLENDLVHNIAVATGMWVEHLVVDLRVYVSVDPRVKDKQGREPGEVMSTIHAFLCGAAPFHDFEWRTDHFAIVVNESPDDAAAKLRAKLHQRFETLAQWILVTANAPVTRRPSVDRISPERAIATRAEHHQWDWPWVQASSRDEVPAATDLAAAGGGPHR